MARASARPVRAPVPAAAVESVRARRRRILDVSDKHSPAMQPDSKHTREAVLRAALGLFAFQGFDACTMRDLAAAGGVTPPALYNHFESKSQILTQSLWLGLNQFFNEVLGPWDDQRPERWLELVVRRHTMFQIESREIAIASDALLRRETIRRYAPKRDADVLVGTQREYVELVRELAAAASRTSSSKRSLTDAFAIVAACDGVAGWYRPDGDFTPNEIATQTWQMVRRIVAPQRPNRPRGEKQTQEAKSEA